MTKRMLIDASHPEETRAVVLDGSHLVDFDFETSTKQQLKGNIYLAKITRVEPSLQAAFVEYGGNRHGFLAFSEIHPDYFQIPAADRKMLEELEGEAGARAAERELDAEGNGHGGENDDESERSDLLDEQARRRARLLRSYKIQEVVKRRQIMLVQVVKEERGNKGAALTTYLSLAGRYCVLMPNTPRGGGISRKIMNNDDRKKLKEIAQELEVPQGMGLIIRTAGQERTRAEIRRDYEYLLRLWNEIRETTLQSVAPKVIYAEGDLIKRALRDLYSRDIEEVLVEGDEGFKSARRLMAMLMPSRLRSIKKYEDEIPLFYKYRIEDQLDAMHSPIVPLPSGGSIVLHTTEALTAIDVNSGRSTRERHIDETAVKTNLEAADEAARQLRLRDVAGLIVIDFIDMAEGRHHRAVEKRLRDALKLDRARLQLGKISQFGLMELSRQRMRASLQELSSEVCRHCMGTGYVRSTEGCALQVLRAVQDAGIRREGSVLQVTIGLPVALYLLNQKRDLLVRMEERYAMRVHIAVDESVPAGVMRLDVLERHVAEPEPPATDEPAADGRAPVARHEPAAREDVPEPVEREEVAEQAAETVAAGEDGEEGGKRRRRRRRRRRRGGGEGAPSLGTEVGVPTAGRGLSEEDDEPQDELPVAAQAPTVAEEVVPLEAAVPPPVEVLPVPGDVVVADADVGQPAELVVEEPPLVAEVAPAPVEPEAEAEAPKRRRRAAATRAPKKAAVTSTVAEEPAGEAAPKAAKPRTRRKKVVPETVEAVPEPAAQPTPSPELVVSNGEAAHAPAPEREPEPVAAEPPRPARQGWWSRFTR